MTEKNSIKSIIGSIRKETGGLESIFGKAAVDPMEITIDGSTYFVGEYAEKATLNPVSNLTCEHFTQAGMLLPLLYASSAFAADGLPRTAVISLPMDVILNDKRKKAVTGSIRDLIVGEHNYWLNGAAKKLIIDKASFTAQGLAALYSYVFDDQGRMIVPEETIASRIGVLDFGYGTMDLFSLDDMEIVPGGCAGYDLGVSRPLHLLKADLQMKTGLSIKDDKALKILSGTVTTISNADGTHDVRSSAQTALDVWTAEISDKLQQHIRDGRDYSKLLVTGGGSYLLTDHLSRFKSAISLPDPIYANALGCYRLGKYRGISSVLGIDPGFFAYKVAGE